MTIDEEVKQCFKENPDLVQKSMRELAIFFFIQGQLSYSNLMQASKNKANHYRRYLNEESKKKADKEWSSLHEAND